MTDRYACYRHLRLDRPVERVLRITLNRPERMNAMTAAMHTELTHVWRDIDLDTSVSAVLLCGEGRAFSAGGELDFVEELIKDHEARLRAWREARDLVYNMVNCSKPIVSAMQGVAVGGGLVIGLLADIPIAAKDARLMDGHTRLGICAGDHAVIIWPLLCGMARAKYYLLTGEPVTGAKAEEIGLVALAVEEAELQQTALDVATRLASGPPTALRWTKYALNNWLRMAGPAFDASTALEMLGLAGPEAREGLAAHREKRAPVFDQNSPV
jgi:enoyl-CoA hydratase